MGDCYVIIDLAPLYFKLNYLKSKIDQYVIDMVRKRRIELRLSQADIAYELGMSVGFIGMVESKNYKSHYNLSHINELARILNCSPQDFLPKKPL